jgi:cytochrome c biogenesis protein CcdA
MDGPAIRDTEGDGDGSESRGRSLRHAVCLTAGVSIVHVLLFLLAFLYSTVLPSPDASDTEVLAFYNGDSQRRIALLGAYLVPFAGIAFVWSTVAPRVWISGNVRRKDVLFSNIQLVSGILFIAVLLVRAAASGVLAVGVEFTRGSIDPVVSRQFPRFGPEPWRAGT